MKALLRLAICLLVTATVSSQSVGTHIPLSRLLRRFRQQPRWPPVQTTAAPQMRWSMHNSPLQRRWQQLRSRMRSQAPPTGRNIARIDIPPRTNTVLDDIRARRARQRQEAQERLWAQRERQRQLDAQRAQQQQQQQQQQQLAAQKSRQELEAMRAQQELAALQEKQRMEALQAQQELEALRAKQQLDSQKALQQLEAQKAKQQLDALKAKQHIVPENQHIVPEKTHHLHQQTPDIHKTVVSVNNASPVINNKRLERLMAKERRLNAKKERISKMRNNNARQRKLERVGAKLQSVAKEIVDIMNTGILDPAHGGHLDHSSGGLNTHDDHLGAPAVLKDIDLSKGIPDHVMAETNRPLPGHGSGAHNHVGSGHANTHSGPVNPNNVGFRINDMPIIDLASAINPSEQIRRHNIMAGNTASADHSRAHAGHGGRGVDLRTDPAHMDHGGHKPFTASGHTQKEVSQPWTGRHVDVHIASDVRPGGTGSGPTSSGGIRLTSGELMPMPMRQHQATRSASTSGVSSGSKLTGFLGNIPGQIRRNP